MENVRPSDEEAVPAVCYDVCNNAYKVGLSTGKTVTLCKSGGSFMDLYNSCLDCIEDDALSSGTESSRNLVSPRLKQFADFCESSGSLTESESSPNTVNLNTAVSSKCVGCQTSIITDWQGDVLTVVLGTEKVSGSLSEPTIKTQVMTITQTYRPSSVSTPTSSNSQDPIEPEPKTNVGLIAGTTVAVVVIVLLAIFFGVRWYRRRQHRTAETTVEANEKKDSDLGKAQLHSDCIPIPTFELEGSLPVAKNQTVVTDANADAEMAANEVAAHEKSTQKDNKEQVPEDVQDGKDSGPSNR